MLQDDHVEGSGAGVLPYSLVADRSLCCLCLLVPVEGSWRFGRRSADRIHIVTFQSAIFMRSSYLHLTTESNVFLFPPIKVRSFRVLCSLTSSSACGRRAG